MVGVGDIYVGRIREGHLVLYRNLCTFTSHLSNKKCEHKE